ncbi:pentapeptide repeat-containing protein [Rhodococcoides fascians]|uniref:pentapeptide repeat-containing protein n=1 Tax=Rhodococcoides fascians TaxID=1828 RepID=UPI003CF3E18A
MHSPAQPSKTGRPRAAFRDARLNADRRRESTNSHLAYWLVRWPDPLATSSNIIRYGHIVSSSESVPAPTDDLDPAVAATPANPTAASIRRRAELWIERHKISLGGCFAIGFAGGFAGPTAWDWYLRQDITPGHGTIIGGFFVVTAAAIAYTGTHLTRTSTERIADQKNTLDTLHAARTHDLADIQELRRRFVTTTAQFADPSPEVRLAGVYALEALTNDWIDRDKPDDAQTCINYLCGYLTRPYSPPTHDPHLRQTLVTPDIGTTVQRTYIHPHDDLNVRQAITRTIAAHLQPRNHHNWSAFNYDLTGAHFHNADFSGSHFRGTADFTEAAFDGQQTSFNRVHFYGETTFTKAKFLNKGGASFYWAEFRGAQTLFNGTHFYGEQATSFLEARFHSKDVTSFVGARFYSKVELAFVGARFRNGRTSFSFAQFHGVRTDFGGVRFQGVQTDFGGAQFRSEQTSFDGTLFKGGRTLFEKAEFHGAWAAFTEARFHSKERTTFAEAQFRSARTSFHKAQYQSEQTTFREAQFYNIERTTFAEAQFHSKDSTSFNWVQFHGVHTDFGGAQFRSASTTFDGVHFQNVEPTSFRAVEFSGKRTTFVDAKFHDLQTSFDSPKAWNNVYFDWDIETPYRVMFPVPKPDSVTPHSWPPTVVESD